MPIAVTSMVRRLRYPLVLTSVLVAILTLGALIAIGTIVYRNYLLSSTNLIRDLQELPFGPVTLKGVVTHVDEAGKRVWLQDESGAVAVNVDPAKVGIYQGQLVRLKARKTHAYDAQIGFTSVALQNVRVDVVSSRVALPAAAPATIETLADSEKNGARLTLEGVLRRVSKAPGGQTILELGVEQEVSAILPVQAPELANWINAKVRITGINDSLSGQGGGQLSRHIRVQNREDIVRVENTPGETPLYTVRDLYRLRHDLKGRIVRMRGRVVSLEPGNAAQLEDEWGLVLCHFDALPSVAPGRVVEIAGFPLGNGLRIDLAHSVISVEHLPAAQRPGKHLLPVAMTVADVKRLNGKEAETALPVQLTGVVTYLDTDWRQLFLQDSTGGIFIKYAGTPAPLHQGDRVRVEGVTDPGDYAPVIVAAKFSHLGKGKLPKPVPLSTAALSGDLDSRFIEVTGVIHPLRVQQNPDHLLLDLYTWLGPIQVNLPPDFKGRDSVHYLEDATVRMRGVCGETFNSRRQMIGIQLAVSGRDDIQVLEARETDPLASAAVPIDSLSRFSPGGSSGHRVKVSGSVTLLGDKFFYVQDETGGVRVQAETAGLHLADLVDAAGYVTPAGYSPGLSNAVVKVRGSNRPVEAKEISADLATHGKFDSRLVSVEGKLLSILSPAGSRILVLHSAGQNFDAVLYLLESKQAAPALEVGSTLRLIGICSAEMSGSNAYELNVKNPVGFQLVIRSPRDIQVLRQASWWNLRHTSVLLAILVLVVFACVGWVTMLRWRIHAQKQALVKAKEKAETVEKLTSAMQEVTREKRFTSQVAIRGNDEIAGLGVEFNKMLAELHLRDVAKSRAEQRLQEQALTDELTGLPNRRSLMDRMPQLVELAKRDGRLVAVLYVDLDGFKLVNDTLGHTSGDQLLTQVANRLRSQVRKSDLLARLGGDEFTVVLSRIRSCDEAALVGTNLLHRLAQPFSIDNHEISIAASIGISLFPKDATDPMDLLQHADSAMYLAKRNGKNQVMYFTPEIGAFVRERSTLEGELRGAVARGEIDVHYQPEFDLATRKLVRFEALARWSHPTLGSIPPDKFIPVAEETGLIIPLGAHILERACADAVCWQSLSEHPVQVAVNVSSIQFLRKTFVEDVEQTLQRTGLDPVLLQLELTESAMLQGPDYAADVMRRLRALGISLAIDDFGTGYSCFNYLPRLPFTTLKIDRSFLRDTDRQVQMKAMIESLVTLAHNLQMQVVVEGIETPEQLHLIELLGGNQVQGYLLGRPTASPNPKLFDTIESGIAAARSLRDRVATPGPFSGEWDPAGSEETCPAGFRLRD